jgi:hypothetical protein
MPIIPITNTLGSIYVCNRKELRKVFTGVVHTNPDFYMSTIQKSISIKSLLRLRTFTRNTPYEVLFTDNAY